MARKPLSTIEMTPASAPRHRETHGTRSERHIVLEGRNPFLPRYTDLWRPPCTHATILRAGSKLEGGPVWPAPLGLWGCLALELCALWLTLFIHRKNLAVSEKMRILSQFSRTIKLAASR